MYRTHYCGDITESLLNKEVIISGWVHTRRDHGGVVFFDLRDIAGLVQVVYRPEECAKDASLLNIVKHGIKTENVLKVTGSVVSRPEGTQNSNLKTGKIEVLVKQIEILNESKPPVFDIDSSTEVSEDIRLKYRYLDLRNPLMQDRLKKRSRFINELSAFIDNEKFIAVETPILTKSTPEGARDYLVPSRVENGAFYALPQSPQLFKQLLMIAGFDRYFQVAKCFRDEDLRADRQPEFTQLDMEMSFVNEEDIYDIIERMLKHSLKVFGVDVSIPFPRMSYEHAVSLYGTDAPDVRFEMTISDLTDLYKNTEFKVLRSVVNSGGRVLGISVPNGASFSRKELDNLIEKAKELGAKGLLWGRLTDKGLESPVSKFMRKEEITELTSILKMKENDLMLVVSDVQAAAQKVLGALRVFLAKKLNMIDENIYKFVWINKYPLFEYDDEEKRYKSMHHPFTSPDIKNAEDMDQDILGIKSRAYDIVVNGSEIGGGSIRIHRKDIQERVFKLLNIEQEEAKEKFGFLLEGLEYGAPPHGGIALGLDRIVMIFCKTMSIRDVIGFPKTQKASCLLTHAPSHVDDSQLKELGIKLRK
ncbi:aspartate--tRNA ligase [bacterium]